MGLCDTLFFSATSVCTLKIDDLKHRFRFRRGSPWEGSVGASVEKGSVPALGGSAGGGCVAAQVIWKGTCMGQLAKQW